MPRLPITSDWRLGNPSAPPAAFAPKSPTSRVDSGTYRGVVCGEARDVESHLIKSRFAPDVIQADSDFNIKHDTPSKGVEHQHDYICAGMVFISRRTRGRIN